MKAREAIAAVILAGLVWSGCAAAKAAGPRDESAAHSDFILYCGGCHGFDGVTNAKAVPDLRRQVGYFLNLPEGRAYLARLPNVAFQTVPDAQLAEILNYMVFVIGADSPPAGARPYSAAEIGRLRKQPLTGAPLRAYRDGLVDTLIAKYGAPEAMRLYGQENYGTGNSGF